MGQTRVPAPRPRRPLRPRHTMKGMREPDQPHHPLHPLQTTDSAACGQERLPVRSYTRQCHRPICVGSGLREQTCQAEYEQTDETPADQRARDRGPGTGTRSRSGFSSNMAGAWVGAVSLPTPNSTCVIPLQCRYNVHHTSLPTNPLHTA